VPQVTPAHPLPVRLQFTAVFVRPVTVAENCFCPPVKTVAVRGLMAMLTCCVNVTVAVSDRVGSATEVAVTLTKDGFGTAEGAV
jgi:hypothetical protein